MFLWFPFGATPALLSVCYPFSFPCLSNIVVTREFVLIDASPTREETSERHIVLDKIERQASRSEP